MNALSRARILLGIAIVGPALAVGGVWPWTVPVFAVVVAAALLGGRVSKRRWRVPAGLGLGLLAVGATAVQALPGPGLRETLAPTLHAWVQQAQHGLDASGWPSISVTPADTALEAVRLLALVGLALACAQRSWKFTAGLVAAAGTAVAVVGLVQQGLGLDHIYGLYEAQHTAPGHAPALLATFINPNHQSGLLLLGIFATAGLGVALRHEDGPLEPRLVLGIAGVLQLTALVLSMSRAALLSAAAAGVVAAFVGRDPDPRKWPNRWMPRAAWLATLAGLVLGVGTLGAFSELSTLFNGSALDHATLSRLQLTASAPGLLDLSPVVGIGRGAFGDLYPAFDPQPTHVWFSHLECAPLTLWVEWGPLVGGALLVGLPLWWVHAMRQCGT
ncbi:MAG: O-antigen ligase family protein, partial [Deltaproteobacteria bacterium]|nr:O-antigen ligase family protein [Deltaproteobacteria bacterium]